MEKTALYNFHKNLGAKFVAFAGYEMPIQYKDGIVKEHISTRQTAGFFDVSHMGQLFISGSKSLEQNLEKIIPLDFKEIKIKPFKKKYKAIFIRAPKIKSLNKDIEILSKFSDTPVMIKKGHILGTTFHPELTDDKRIHEYFINMIESIS